MMGRICPPGWDRVKVFENLGATAVVPVAPVNTFLPSMILSKRSTQLSVYYSYFREPSSHSTVAGRGKISEPSTAGTSNLDWRYFEYY